MQFLTLLLATASLSSALTLPQTSGPQTPNVAVPTATQAPAKNNPSPTNFAATQETGAADFSVSTSTIANAASVTEAAVYDKRDAQLESFRQAVPEILAYLNKRSIDELTDDEANEYLLPALERRGLADTANDVGKGVANAVGGNLASLGGALAQGFKNGAASAAADAAGKVNFDGKSIAKGAAKCIIKGVAQLACSKAGDVKDSAKSALNPSNQYQNYKKNQSVKQLKKDYSMLNKLFEEHNKNNVKKH